MGMHIVKGAALFLVGITIGVAWAWLLPQGSSSDEGAEVARRLAELDRRLNRLERVMSDAAAHSLTDTSPNVIHLQGAVNQLEEQIPALTHASVSPTPSTSLNPGARHPTGHTISGRDSEPSLPTPGIDARHIDARHLEYVVTDMIASLAPKYLEEQVSQLYTAQKQADQEAQREAEQRRREEGQERRLAQLISDLQQFVPGLSHAQVEEVAQVIREQWDVMGAMRQQASAQGTFITPGEILQRARTLTDEKLYVLLSPPQVDAYRLWRETRFGTAAGVAR